MNFGAALETPLFVTGVQRSGTTLLRTILCAHPEIWVSYECAFYKILGEQYRRGIEKKSIQQFVQDLQAVKRFPIWNISDKTIKRILSEHPGERIDFAWAVRRIALENLTDSKRAATTFGFKNPHGIYHLNYIWDLFPKARVINVIRDPRGILASEKSRQQRTGQYRSASAIWQVRLRYKQMATAHHSAIGDLRYLPVLYSDLVANFELTIRRIIRFLGLDFHPDILEYHTYAQQNDLTPKLEMHLHSLTLKKPEPARLYAFRDSLSDVEQASLESMLGREMREVLNVTPDHSAVTRTMSEVRVMAQLVYEKGTRWRSGV